MFTLLRLIILRNWRSLMILMFVIIFTGMGFITLGQLTTNIETSVADETRPIFGADMIISIDSYTGNSLYATFSPYLINEDYKWAERYEFSTTLFDKSGKSGLVKVVAYTGSYPQRGLLKTENYGVLSTQIGVSATSELINRFSTGGDIVLDGKKLPITQTILESSDIGFSFATENHLMILPASLLSGSMLLSSGSRLDHELLLSFADEKKAGAVKKSLEKIFLGDTFRIRTYEERTDRALEIVDELTNYILLILVLSSIFVLVVLRSAHTTFFENLSYTLRISQILGFTQRRQKILFTFLYIIILPVSLILSGVLAYGLLRIIATYPEAESFGWDFSSFFSSLFLLALLIFASFFPAWKDRWQHPKASRFNIFQSHYAINIFIGIIVLLSIFEDIGFALLVVGSGGVIFYFLMKILQRLYTYIFGLIKPKRLSHFLWYDGVRTLIRPLTPTVPITISLVSVTSLLGVFTLFSYSFYSELQIDLHESANMFALNVLESDREKIEKVLTGSEMYSILRARISRVNNKTLAEHLSTENPSGEFTREFNITTNSLKNKIIKGKEELLADEVSVDEDFAKRLGITTGDTLDFLLSGKNITLTVASIRESTRQGFKPFFYFSLNPTAFRTAPKTYFISTYTPDKDVWKRLVIENSGPHVTFVDVENILLIVRDISQKIISIIGLFLLGVGGFAFFAILSFFSQMKKVESMKKKLYKLFGLRSADIATSLNISRGVILGVSGILSLCFAVIIGSWITYTSSILSLSWISVGIVVTLTIAIYSLLSFILKQR